MMFKAPNSYLTHWQGFYIYPDLCQAPGPSSPICALPRKFYFFKNTANAIEQELTVFPDIIAYNSRFNIYRLSSPSGN